MLAKAILVHGVIGYKFCWLLPSEDHNQGTPNEHESNGTIVRDYWEDMNQLRHQLGTYQATRQPMRCCNSFLLFGVSVSRTTFTWAKLTSIPLWVTINHRNFLALTLNAYLAGLSFMLYARIIWNGSSKCWMCSTRVLLFTTMLSM